jgi:hypothetical protein
MYTNGLKDRFGSPLVSWKAMDVTSDELKFIKNNIVKTVKGSTDTMSKVEGGFYDDSCTAGVKYAQLDAKDFVSDCVITTLRIGYYSSSVTNYRRLAVQVFLRDGTFEKTVYSSNSIQQIGTNDNWATW